MMWRVYYAALAFIGPCALVAFRLYNFVVRTKRVRVILRRPDERILLVVNAVGDRRWVLPGGGAHRREKLEVAAAREIREELSLHIDTRNLEYVGEIRTNGYDAPIFVAELTEAQVPQIKHDKYEIYATMWSSTEDLPVKVQSLVHTSLDLLSRRVGVGKIK